MNVEEIDFILSHFVGQIQLFPRKMMTDISKGQFSVTTVEGILKECKQADFINCRINAYAEYTEYKGILRQSPDFVFIDLDLTQFDYDKRRLNSALKKTLNKMKKVHGNPTVLWTGNGYHIYQPVKGLVLDQEVIFSKNNFPNLFSVSGKYSGWYVSEVFLKFSEMLFTDRKADPLHTPKYKTCLIRIPGTYNSKILKSNRSKEESLVRIIQRWDGRHLPIQFLLKEFRRWIAQEEIDQRIRSEKLKIKYGHRSYDYSSNRFTIAWIDKLLQIPITDHRKYCLWRILVPYLLNVKKKGPEETTLILIEWLQRCNQERRLDFNIRSVLRSNIRSDKGYMPIAKEKLSTLNRDLYAFLKTTKVITD
ncbi:MAG: hypothetical protein L0H53_08540 [Candidatus Nitrosocosmicus sp.]|nr:hypothetical protein [Candidatus Nitrosocosmicus sp.]MDN5867383.1 hypothetical protein [Candidatus Nitrosocosmicus sp.]